MIYRLTLCVYHSFLLLNYALRSLLLCITPCLRALITIKHSKMPLASTSSILLCPPFPVCSCRKPCLSLTCCYVSVRYLCISHHVLFHSASMPFTSFSFLSARTLAFLSQSNRTSMPSFYIAMVPYISLCPPFIEQWYWYISTCPPFISICPPFSLSIPSFYRAMVHLNMPSFQSQHAFLLQSNGTSQHALL